MYICGPAYETKCARLDGLSAYRRLMIAFSLMRSPSAAGRHGDPSIDIRQALR